MDVKIVIGIPTYNRPDLLVKRLNEIEQFTDFIFGVIVSDNSDDFNDEANEICKKHSNWHYHKNSKNIGGGANFIRLIELCSVGTHLWWRGDDDPISQFQIDAVFSCELSNNELLLLKPTQTPTFTGIGLKDYCSNFNETKAVGWISMVIVPLKYAQEAIPFGYWGVHTGWAHVCLILGMFKQNEDIAFKVVAYKPKDEDFREKGKEGQRWGFFNTCLLNFSKTANIISDNTLRNLYLKNWRKTQNFRYVKTMVGVRIGLSTPEEITWTTLKPLLSLQNPTKITLFATLYFLAKCPQSIIIFFTAIWAKFQTQDLLNSKEIGLVHGKSIIESYTILNQKAKTLKAGGFL